MPRRPPPVGSEAVRKSDGQTRRVVLAMFAMAMLVLLSNIVGADRKLPPLE
jgi:hypothetical protein